MESRGWGVIQVGFGLILFGALLDISDNFDSLGRFVILGDTEPQAILENVVGYTAGFAFLMIGLVIWGPTVERLRLEALARKRAVDAERDARLEAERANAAKSDFLANMSHEFRTPLNAIIGFSGMMREQVLGPLGHPRYVEYLEDIARSGDDLLALIDDVLDISKIDSGTVLLSESIRDLVEVRNQAALLVGPQFQAKGIAYTQTDFGVAVPVLVDASRVRQIMLNLLVNAAKYTPANGRIECRVGVDGFGRAFFSVIDTGIGMTSTEIEIALSPFQQVGATPMLAREGVGLGLPLCRRIAALHDADLTIKSRKGVGTTVTVTFPTDRFSEGLLRVA